MSTGIVESFSLRNAYIPCFFVFGQLTWSVTTRPKAIISGCFPLGVSVSRVLCPFFLADLKHKFEWHPKRYTSFLLKQVFFLSVCHIVLEGAIL